MFDCIEIVLRCSLRHMYHIRYKVVNKMYVYSPGQDKRIDETAFFAMWLFKGLR